MIENIVFLLLFLMFIFYFLPDKHKNNKGGVVGCLVGLPPLEKKKHRFLFFKLFFKFIYFYFFFFILCSHFHFLKTKINKTCTHNTHK